MSRSSVALFTLWAAMACTGLLACGSNAPSTAADNQPAIPDAWECDSCGVGSELEIPDTLHLNKPGPTRFLGAGDHDHSVFWVDSGVAYQFAITASQPASVILSREAKYSSEGLAQGRSRDPIAHGTWRYTSTASEWLHLRSQMLASSDSGTYSYLVTLATPIVADAFEPSDDSMGTAYTIKPDSTLHARTIIPGNLDWFQAPLDSGVVYGLSLYGQSFMYARLEEFGISTSLSPGSSHYLKPTRSMTLHIGMLTVDSGGAYGIRLFKTSEPSPNPGEPDNLATQATSITPDSSILERYMEWEGEDWFSFQAVKGTVYRVDVPYHIRGVSPAFCDQAGNKLVAEEFHVDIPGLMRQSWTASFTGTAYLRVVPWWNQAFGPYTIALSQKP